MNSSEKTKEELQIQLNELTNKLNSLQLLYNNKIGEDRLITDRLEKCEKTNHLLSDSFLDSVIVRENNVILFISKNHLAFLGYDPIVFSDFTLEQIYSYVHEKDLSNLKEIIEQAYSNHTPQITVEYRIRNAKNQYVWAETRVKFEYNDKGNPYRSTIVTKDISERKTKENSFKQKKAKFKFLTENASDVIWHLDQDYRCDYISLADEKLRGYTQDEVIGTHLFDILKPEAAQMLQINIAKRIANAKLGLPMEMPHYELEQKCKDGSWVWVETTANPEYDENGNIIGLHGVTRNITERKKAEIELKLKSEQLMAAIADKDQFMSILAHDLKGPFSSILAFLEWLSDNINSSDIDTIQQDVSIACESAQRTLELLEDLLLWGQAQSGKLLFAPQNLSLKNILDEIATVLNVNAHAKDIAIYNLVPEEVVVFADSNMLKTVLRNLISNAIKFTYPHGAIELRANEAIDHVVIEIADNGMGIKPEVLITLFSMRQIYTSRGTANESGTGLGLYLCKEFIEKNGGVIWAESPNTSNPEKKGTIFSFTTPTRK